MSFKYQTLIFSICQSSGVDDLWTPVLINLKLCLYFRNLTFQLDQRFYSPFLYQWSRSPSSLWTSEISSLKLYFPSKYADYCHMSSWIKQLRLTSGLYLKSIDLRHVSSGSNDPDPLWTIQCLRFTLDDLTIEIYFYDQTIEISFG